MNTEISPQKLPERIIKSWRVAAAIRFVIFEAIILGTYLVVNHKVKAMWVDITFPSIMGLILLTYLANFFLARYRWNFWRYQVTNEKVELHNGYFFRKKILIPISRIQNVDLIQGPILRHFDLQKLTIYTAADSFDIDGVEEDQAQDLRNLILKFAKEDQKDV